MFYVGNFGVKKCEFAQAPIAAINTAPAHPSLIHFIVGCSAVEIKLHTFSMAELTISNARTKQHAKRIIIHSVEEIEK